MSTGPNPGEAGSVPQHFMPPSARELRAQSVHRLQIGLFGLAAMLLLVGLANIIMDRARLAESTMPPPAGLPSEAPTPGNDPLADIGVIPSPGAVPAATVTPGNDPLADIGVVPSPATSAQPEAVLVH
ncbi:MAG: hypothetical protein FP826_15175 [Sphingomonadales bacterium]|nr:hypothetical protein [Sphingomonadales bacterium]MBU3991374.1 hypothetical protein [Alphaproteobacteria bacterium]